MAKMMQRDLDAAREAWIAEAQNESERQRRASSDFLTYRNENGLYADFHANRHTFISRLGRSGLSMMTAQKLARHSDPRLTSNVYDHLQDEEKAAAIGVPKSEAIAPVETTSEASSCTIVAQTAVVSGQDESTSIIDARVGQSDWDLS